MNSIFVKTLQKAILIDVLPNFGKYTLHFFLTKISGGLHNFKLKRICAKFKDIPFSPFLKCFCTLYARMHCLVLIKIKERKKTRKVQARVLDAYI